MKYSSANWWRLAVTTSVSALALWVGARFIVDPWAKIVWLEAIRDALIIIVLTIWAASFLISKLQLEEKEVQQFGVLPYIRGTIIAYSVAGTMFLLYPVPNNRSLSPDSLIREAFSDMVMISALTLIIVSMARVVLSANNQRKLWAAFFAVPAALLMFLILADVFLFIPAWIAKQK